MQFEPRQAGQANIADDACRGILVDLGKERLCRGEAPYLHAPAFEQHAKRVQYCLVVLDQGDGHARAFCCLATAGSVNDTTAPFTPLSIASFPP